MGNKKIAVFGANSKSAIHLINILKRENYQVESFSSSETKDAKYNFDIYQNHIPQLNCDYAIYFSWARKRSFEDQAVAARKALEFAKSARQQDVNVIFISSLAALPKGMKSFYGFSKHTAEQGMREYGHVIIRPGTIVSKFDPTISVAMKELHRFRGFIWLYSRFSKKILVPLLSIDAFCAFLLKTIEEDKLGEFDLFNDAKTLENLAGFKDFRVRLPLDWIRIFGLTNKGAATDRLVTLLSVSSWFRENQE